MYVIQCTVCHGNTNDLVGRQVLQKKIMFDKVQNMLARNRPWVHV